MGIDSAPNVAKVFDQQAEVFDQFSRGSFHWRHMEKPALDRHLAPLLRPDTRAFDVGCGGGRMAEYLVEHGVPQENITGIDVSKNLLARAKEKMPGADFKEGDASKLEIDKRFDLAVSHMVFEFLDTRQLRATLQNIHRHLNPGGILFYVTVHPNKDPKERRDRTWTDTSAPWGGDIPVYRRPLEDLIEETKSAGFEIDTVLDLRFLDSAREEDEMQYKKYEKYGPMRLLVKAHRV